MPMIEQVTLERKELLRANLHLRDENLDLRFGLELLERRLPELARRAQFAEERWRYWRFLTLWATAGFLFVLILWITQAAGVAK